MKTLVVKIPEALAAEIEAEAREKGMKKSDVVRRRLARRDDEGPRELTMWDLTRDIIEKAERETPDTGPRDVSARKKYYLRKWGFGKNKRRP